MSFPDTRHTLIQRISRSAGEDDWREFLSDYWRPLCRFAARWAKLDVEDAEDVASATIEAVIRNQLLSRWASNRQAKLRTLLCAVARNVLSNRARIETGRARLLRENHDARQALMASFGGKEPQATPNQLDAFYTAWAEELLQDAVESLLDDYLRSGRGDYFRVLYGRICEEMTMPEIAQSLDLKLTAAENYYKHARKRLGETLKRMVRQRVQRYSPPDEFESEFQAEWSQFGEFLTQQGGIVEVIRKSYEGFDSTEVKRRENSALTAILTQVGPLLKQQS